jgi:Stage II sporulation protein E (SpoIIE)
MNFMEAIRSVKKGDVVCGDIIHPTMLHRRLQILIPVALLVFSCAAACSAADAGSRPDTLVVSGLGTGTVELGGLWEFKTGDDPAWASPQYDDSQWKRLRVDRFYARQGFSGYNGYAWYRRHIDFEAARAGQKVVLLVAPIGGTDAHEQPYEIYWNGVLIGGGGKMPPGPEWRFRPPDHSFALGQAQAGVLAIRTWTAPPKFVSITNRGGLDVPPRVGSPEAVVAELSASDHEWLADRQFYYDENLLFCILGVLGLLAWLRNRSLKALFWIAIYAILQPVHVVLYNAHLGLPYGFVYGFDVLCDTVAGVSLWCLLLHLLDLNGNFELKRWTYRLAVTDILFGLFEWFVDSRDWSTPLVHTWQIADAVLYVLITLASLFPLVLIAYGIGRRVSFANWLVAASASSVYLIGAVRIASLGGARFTHFVSLYYLIQSQIFTIHGNYFDAQNIAVSVLLLSIIYAAFRYSEEQSQRRGALEQDLRSAQELQRILIPEELSPLKGYAMTSAYRPALEVGGDFYQVIALRDGATLNGAGLIVIGDVSGKGLKAAMTVSLLVGTVRTFAEQSSDPAAILAGLNRRLEGRMGHGFVTCMVLRVGPSGECVVASAGHLPPFLNQEEMKLAPALPLGLVAEAVYENVAFTMRAGDRLTLYTDGLLEARNAARELYGFGRVRELMATNPDAQTASEAAVAFGQDDDITVLTLARVAAPVISARMNIEEVVAPAAV